MLPDITVPCSLADVLLVFRWCFTAPTFRTFSGLVVGLIASTRRRTVWGMLLGAGLERFWHHSRAHRLFAVARWSTDAVGVALADLIVARLVPAGSPLTIAVDDTLFTRSGKKVFGVAWHHDGAAKGPKPIGFAQLLGRGRHHSGTAILIPAGVLADPGSAVATSPYRQDRLCPRDG
jgi:hypothetical protein